LRVFCQLDISGYSTTAPRIPNSLPTRSLAATLLSQLQLPHADFRFSRDVFNSDYSYPFAFFAFNNGMGFRDSTGVSVYDNTSKTVIFTQPAPNENRVNRAQAILQTIYDDLGGK
jgi:hypothetical protein